MRSKKYCKSYVGVACVNGSCPNALRNEDIEAYEDVSVLLNHESTDTTKKFYIKQDIRRISSVKNRYNI